VSLGSSLCWCRDKARDLLDPWSPALSCPSCLLANPEVVCGCSASSQPVRESASSAGVSFSAGGIRDDLWAALSVPLGIFVL
jgi:hypothetical protein